MNAKVITTNWRTKFDTVMKDHLMHLKKSVECEKRPLLSRRDEATEILTLTTLINKTDGMGRGETLVHFATAVSYHEALMNNLSYTVALRHASSVALNAIEHVLIHRIMRTDVLDTLYDRLIQSSPKEEEKQ